MFARIGKLEAWIAGRSFSLRPSVEVSKGFGRTDISGDWLGLEVTLSW